MNRFLSQQRSVVVIEMNDDDDDQENDEMTRPTNALDDEPPLTTTTSTTTATTTRSTSLPCHSMQPEQQRQDDNDWYNQELHNEFFHFPCSTMQLAKARVKFFVFLRLLVKHLELHDTNRYGEVQAVLQEFCQQSRILVRAPHRAEGSFLWDLYSQVKALVTRAQWHAAHGYFRILLLQRRRNLDQRRQDRRRAAGGGTGICAIISSDGS